MANPNNCETCHYREMHDGDGFCYLFRNEPDCECKWHSGRKESLRDLLPKERECCGTFPGTHHRATCEKYRGKFSPSNAEITGDEAGRPKASG